MFELMLMRHAKSDWSSHTADIDRPLNASGAADAERIGAYLKQMDIIPSSWMRSALVPLKPLPLLVCLFT